MDPVDEQPAPVFTVTDSVRLLPEFALNAIVPARAPDVMRPPPVIVHEYVAPEPASGTDAWFPRERLAMESGAVMAADGASRSWPSCPG